MNRSILAVVTASVLITTLALAARNAPQDETVTTWNVDPVHSTVLFKVRHLGVSNFYGRFNKVSGTYSIDRENPDASTMVIEIPTASLDTNGEGRDQHLKGPQFFAVEEHPMMTFTATRIQHRRDDLFKLEGELTLRGETHPVFCGMEWFGEKDAGPRFGVRSGYEARFKIKRSLFGMDTYVKEGALGDEIEIIVAIEGTKAGGAE